MALGRSAPAASGALRCAARGSRTRRCAPPSRSPRASASASRSAGRPPRTGTPWSRLHRMPSPRVADTVEGWRSWEAEHDIYDGPHRELVRMSSRVLKGLSYRPTGAIVAAPTTSLPETVGGERNWDYRFSWIRDSSLTIEALYIGTCSDEAEEFVSFMTSSAAAAPARARSRSCTGSAASTTSRSASCRTCAAGASRPGPGRQRRLGPGAARRLRRAPELALAVPREARRAASRDPGVRGRPRRHRRAPRWTETDSGMWERGEPRHHLSSKVLC